MKKRNLESNEKKYIYIFSIYNMSYLKQNRKKRKEKKKKRMDETCPVFSFLLL